ncbi:Sterol 3-beta-glucosyltransferase UGT80A2 [Camellia lanceoleosa]|uniref:Sterol 3-beta-glucosyltransferase UGT80A2 n=1 Tax=Camellia lanceoleosa TaxID=1840588 RepID=A0ACC0F895_9ERIC|nr:Sterol 3-beta-glucosyltransferase UGT80A2 [Camellia lanceoleosa]
MQVKERAVELAKAMENEDGVMGAVKAFFKHLPRKKPEPEIERAVLLRKNAKSVEPSSPLPLPPKKPTFSCPVCIGLLVEEMSTKCGHIFCKSCIKTTIAAQGKCPTYWRKITFKDSIRIYLRATN